MKILAIIAGILFLMVGVCQAAPFLVCDPNPGATKYMLEMDGVELPEGVCEADGSLRHDMTAYVNTGNHTVRAKAGNVWGWSTYSDPFDFDADVPNQASNVGLSE